MKRPPLMGFALSLVGSLALSATASAASFTWNKTSGTHPWVDAANWDSVPDGVPGAGDTAIITPVLTGILNITFADDPSVGILHIGDAGSGSGLIQFNPGGSSRSLTFDNLGSDARLNKTSANLVDFKRIVRLQSNTVFAVDGGEVRFSGTVVRLGGEGALIVEGPGLTTFASDLGASFSTSYGGNVAIQNAGTLLVNATFSEHSTTPGATVAVNSTGHLGGAGTVGRGTTVKSGGVLTPGAALGAAGVLSFSSGLNLEAGSRFAFELKADTVADRGSAFDGIDVTGGNLVVANGSVFDLTFDGSGSTVDFTSEFWKADQEWLVFDNANAATIGAFTLGNVSTDAFGNAFSITGGSFGFKELGSDLYLTYAAVPEPRSIALLFGSCAMAVALFRRKSGRGVVK